MADRSKIEWTTATWNPLTGCTRVSPGCANCYIDWAPPFRIERRHFTDTTGHRSHAIGATTGVRLHPERLSQPLRWKKPRKVFVNSLSDLFHDEVPDEYVAQVFAVMALAPQHTFQILTKRHARMRSLLRSPSFGHLVAEQGRQLIGDGHDWLRVGAMLDGEPLSNVWLGVTVESQQYANLRIPALLDTPAAVRFLSCEPLLGKVVLCRCDGAQYEVQRHPFLVHPGCPLHGATRIDWVIAGGESGADARPMHPDWARTLRDQSAAAGTAFFFKQWGEWRWAREAEDQGYESSHGDQFPQKWEVIDAAGQLVESNVPVVGGAVVQRVGKKAAGRELDGRTWDEMPRGAA